MTSRQLTRVSTSVEWTGQFRSRLRSTRSSSKVPHLMALIDFHLCKVWKTPLTNLHVLNVCFRRVAPNTSGELSTSQLHRQDLSATLVSSGLFFHQSRSLRVYLFARLFLVLKAVASFATFFFGSNAFSAMKIKREK